jgi:predicted ATPase/DNA-binding SARP family transcriptional activator
VTGPRIEVALLGSLQLRVGGETVALSSMPQRVLLARLALAAGQVVGVAELHDALWGDQPPPNAAGNLHSYVSRLRRTLGPDRVERVSAGYRLLLDDGGTDLDRVERLVSDARAVVPADPAAAADLLGQALACWRGAPLADLADVLAFAPDRARLAEWRQQLLAERFELSLAAGRHGEVLPELEAVALAEPLWERVQLQLIQARHLAGRTADALAAATAYRQRRVAELGLDPGEEFTDLQRRLLDDDPALRPAASAAHVNAPVEPLELPAAWPPVLTDRFIGREAELRQLAAGLAEHRLVTVVGPGGAGKTRLVLELLARRQVGSAEAAYLVELASVTGADEVPVSVAGALGLRAAPEGVAAAIADRIGSEPALLVLDNCEHLLSGVRELVPSLLGRCAGLRVLSTSRRPLGLRGERVARLAQLPEADLVELFCDRAALLRADFEASDTDRAIVAQICGILDGLPLAVELAARRESAFGLAALRDRLAAGLAVLEPARDGDRSTAVTATVEWSYRLLDPDSRQLLDRLSVCRGGFSLDALAHLAPPGVAEPAGLLAELVDASLVSCDLTTDPPRYRLLETVRYGCERHLTAALHDEVRLAHAGWMRAHAELVYARQRARSPAATPLLRRESANLQHALGWLIDAGRWAEAAQLGVLIAVAISDDPELSLMAQLARLEAELPAVDDTAALCALAAGGVAWMGGDGPVAEPLLSAAVDRLPAEHEYVWIARYFRMTNRMFRGDVAGAEADARSLYWGESVPPWARATALCGAALINLFAGNRPAAERWLAIDEALLAKLAPVDGFIAYTRGEMAAGSDPAAALAFFDQAFRQAETQGHSYSREVAAIGRAAVLIRLGRRAEAVAACRVLVDELRTLGMWPQLWMVLRLTAELLVGLGDHASAGALLAAADADPLAPAVLADDRRRHAELWARITAHGAPGPAAGSPADSRSEAVRRAKSALARHS